MLLNRDNSPKVWPVMWFDRSPQNLVRWCMFIIGLYAICIGYSTLLFLFCMYFFFVCYYANWYLIWWIKMYILAILTPLKSQFQKFKMADGHHLITIKSQYLRIQRGEETKKKGRLRSPSFKSGSATAAYTAISSICVRRNPS